MKSSSWSFFISYFPCIFQKVQNYMARLNLAIENMARFKWFWTTLRGSNRPARFMPTVEPYNWKYSEVQICARRFGLLENKIKTQRIFSRGKPNVFFLLIFKERRKVQVNIKSILKDEEHTQTPPIDINCIQQCTFNYKTL